MIRIEAKNLHEAYSKAASELQCSVTEITIDIIQNPSSGFLGMFQKNAIVEARKISEPKSEPKFEKKTNFEEKKFDSNKEEKRKNRNRRSKNRKKENATTEKPLVQTESKPTPTPKMEKKVEKKEPRQQVETSQKVDTKTVFDESFHQPKVDIKVAVLEIKENINKLFKHSCFTLEAIKVDVFNENTVLIEFSGEDSALLIGKEGYRYKSLSYLLYNWVNIKYNLNIRLEIAEFLKNQEEMIDKYLVSVIERVNNNGRAQTKILDGVLVKIALEALRKEFPNKYVGIKSGREGGKFIVINDFNRKNQ